MTVTMPLWLLVLLLGWVIYGAVLLMIDVLKIVLQKIIDSDKFHK